MEIRPYKAADRAGVAEITKRAWSGVTIAQLREEHFGILGGKTWSEQKADQVVSQCDQHPSFVYVAVVDGEVVGYATYGVTANGDVGVVGNNAVHPDYQGRGIGTALVKRVIAEMEAAGVKMLEVLTLGHDKAAQRVYEKCGFSEVCRSVYYFKAPS